MIAVRADFLGAVIKVESVCQLHTAKGGLKQNQAALFMPICVIGR
jgi:hypothetical protein